MTLAEWAVALGVGRHVLYYRLRIGWPYDKVFCSVTRKRLTHNGVTRTKAEWAALSGVAWPTIRARLRAGWDTDKAIFTKELVRKKLKEKPSIRYVTHDGLTLSVYAWGKRSGIRSDTIISRLNRGWSDADAVSKPVRKRA